MVSVPVNRFNIDRYSTPRSTRVQSIEDLLDAAPDLVPETIWPQAPDVLSQRTDP